MWSAPIDDVAGDGPVETHAVRRGVDGGVARDLELCGRVGLVRRGRGWGGRTDEADKGVVAGGEGDCFAAVVNGDMICGSAVGAEGSVEALCVSVMEN